MRGHPLTHLRIGLVQGVVRSDVDRRDCPPPGQLHGHDVTSRLDRTRDWEPGGHLDNLRRRVGTEGERLAGNLQALACCGSCHRTVGAREEERQVARSHAGSYYSRRAGTQLDEFGNRHRTLASTSGKDSVGRLTSPRMRQRKAVNKTRTAHAARPSANSDPRHLTCGAGRSAAAWRRERHASRRVGRTGTGRTVAVFAGFRVEAGLSPQPSRPASASLRRAGTGSTAAGAAGTAR